MDASGTVRLKKGREKKIRNFYPWVQKEEVAGVRGGAQPGEVARLVSHTGEFLAIGLYNPCSRFPFRVLSLQEERIDESFFERRIRAALQLRESLITDADGCRLLFAEADGVPGLIVDRYQETLIVQVRNLGMERLKPLWLPPLVSVISPMSVYEKSDMEGRREEGLGDSVGDLHGALPSEVETNESGLRFLVPVTDGLKTGFYLDQRDTRRKLASEVLPNERIADLFCYTGAFALYAARSGAKVTAVDIHERAIAVARQNAEINGLSVEFVLANAFEWLEEQGRQGVRYDRILLDPPAIAKVRDKRDSLKWAIWKLVYLSSQLLDPGGRMLVCNCSYQLSLAETIETIRLAASDRGRRVFLEGVTYQSPDHPALLQFPESLYLKCVWVRFG